MSDINLLICETISNKTRDRLVGAGLWGSVNGVGSVASSLVGHGVDNILSNTIGSPSDEFEIGKIFKNSIGGTVVGVGVGGTVGYDNLKKSTPQFIKKLTHQSMKRQK